MKKVKKVLGRSRRVSDSAEFLSFTQHLTPSTFYLGTSFQSIIPPVMGQSFTRLTRVLKLEAQQNYKNKAVVGGIRQFITFWVEHARQEAVDEADRAFVEQTADLLLDYANLPGAPARSKAINTILEKLELRQERLVKMGLAPAAPPKPVPAPKPVPEPQPPVETEVTPPPPPPVVQVAPPPPVVHDPLPPAEPRPRRPKGVPNPEGLQQPVSTLYGVGPRIANLLEKLGVYTIGDLLYLLPRRYDDYTAMKPINRLKYGENVTLIGTVWEVRARKGRNNQVVIQAVVSDGTGQIQITWFNQPWLVNKLKAGLRIVLQGQVEQYLGRPVFNNPDWEMLALDALRTGHIVPIYPLTQGLGSHKMRQMMKNVVEQWAPQVPDPLPAATLARQNLMPLSEALYHLHLPESQTVLLEAQRRLMFDELLLLQLGFLGQRREWQTAPAPAVSGTGQLVQALQEALPFSMTGAQQRVIAEIQADMARTNPMNRLLQGDVGAGKTVVAAAALLTAVEAGYQTALMAPTEILAEQHYRGLKKLLEPLGLNLVLLTGSVGAAERRQALEAISNGQAQLTIGTHALIQPEVTFKNLACAVIDEQHRFGVEQRKALKSKGAAGLTPHALVMSATPIPRTLALSFFGDLDLSVLDEMPPGRQEIKTRWMRPRERERCYAFVRGQIEQGRQAYIICPLVEQSDKIEAVSAVQEFERLSTEIFPDLKLGLVHGKLRPDEKEAAMRHFYNNELQILVATSVIEVGVDVPNSTIMLIEGANRFGLAQLHQFRGRVGRGEHQSYCLLIADETTPEAEERLMALEQTNDGFQLAEKDLELRGPGEFFGHQQSGLPELKLASLTNMSLLQQARQEAEQLAQDDPLLTRPEYTALREKVQIFWQKATDVS